MQELNQIKRVDAPEHLYEGVLNKINQRQQNLVPMQWVRVAAAVFICFVSVEAYLLINAAIHQPNGIETIVSLPNNMLYND